MFAYTWLGGKKGNIILQCVGLQFNDEGSKGKEDCESNGNRGCVEAPEPKKRETCHAPEVVVGFCRRVE